MKGLQIHLLSQYTSLAFHVSKMGLPIHENYHFVTYIDIVSLH